jgi:hypothetical protein
VATGARKDKVDRQFAFTKATNGRYIVTQKGDLMFVYDTQGVIVNADGEEKVPIAFFRAPSPVVSVSCAGERAAPCLRCTPRGSQTEVRREHGRGGLSVSWGVRCQYHFVFIYWCCSACVGTRTAFHTIGFVNVLRTQIKDCLV